MSELSDLLKQSLPPGMSRRAVARAARGKGHDLGDATATAYFRGSHGLPDDETLRAFAAVLPVPIEALRRAAGVRGPIGPWTPPPSSEYLSSQQRAALDALIVAFVEREVGEDHVSAANERAAGSAAEKTTRDGRPRDRKATSKRSSSVVRES